MRIVAVQLGQQVFDTCDVHPRLFQLDQRVPLALFVLGNASNFFEEALALLRLHREDAAHLALPDERVVAEPEPCRCQQLFDIPELNIVSVDEEVRFPGTEDAPSHSDLVRARAEHVALVVEHDLGFGIVDGMATRHPVNYAEAEVVFNNEGDVFGTGTDKVTVARRIFRSRESDFLIDGNDVQLRDVEELLTSTGLGFRHYPFIGQGEMSRIFTMKPEERKTLFEEVAGIAEYKQRKRDTLIKLEETRVNIARVEDLLAELNGNYAHLGLQAAAAREYVGYQLRLRDLDMDIAHARYLSVLREQERATARLAEAQEKMAEVIGSLNSRQAAHDDLQTAQRKLSASLREKTSALSEAREDAYRLEKELVSVREKAKYLAAEESRLVRQEQDWDASRLQTV